jgi:hypothetical protein
LHPLYSFKLSEISQHEKTLIYFQRLLKMAFCISWRFSP